MKRERIKLTYEIELQPGEKLNLPASLVNIEPTPRSKETRIQARSWD